MTEICELCSNKYPQEMILDKKYCDFNQCYDCLFSMNFNDKNILNGSMGLTLKEYIELSQKHHANINEIPCQRLSDTGGCYICMELLDIPFDIPNDTNNNTTNTTNTAEKSQTPEQTQNTNDFQSHILIINNDDTFLDADKFILTL
jgi:hypothetical protein